MAALPRPDPVGCAHQLQAASTVPRRAVDKDIYVAELLQVLPDRLEPGLPIILAARGSCGGQPPVLRRPPTTAASGVYRDLRTDSPLGGDRHHAAGAAVAAWAASAAAASAAEGAAVGE